MRTRIISSVMSAIFIFCASTFIVNLKQASAINEQWSGNYGAITKKAMATGISRCYAEGSINNAVSIANFSKISDIIVGNTKVALPNGLTHMDVYAGDKTATVSCKNLFAGEGDFKGIFELAGKTEYKEKITEPIERGNLLENMGYSPKDKDKNCVYYTYARLGNESQNKKYTQNACVYDGKTSAEDIGINQITDPYFLAVSAPVGDDHTLVVNSSTLGASPVYLDARGWSAFRNSLTSTLTGSYAKMGDYEILPKYTENHGVDYVFSSRKSSLQKTMKNLTSYSSSTELEFTKSEKLQYYLNTLKNWFFKDVNESEYYRCDLSNITVLQNYTPINIDTEGHRSSTCGILTSDASKTEGIHGFTNKIPLSTSPETESGYSSEDNYFNADPNATKLDLEAVIAAINIIVNKMTDEELADTSASGYNTNCYDAGIEGTSYIICPAIENGSDFVDWVEDVLEYWLRLSPDEIFSPQMYEAWDTFRNIANIFLIIIFLIIIFSQLTGYGIDNYGIKKMLPRLIVMAIIINLSYVICQLAIDISNILGSGLYDLFRNIGLRLNDWQNPTNTAAIIEAIMSGIGVAGGAIAPTLVAGAVAGGWVGVLIALALLLLTAIAAILVAFVMLGARMAIVIVFVVISPVAFALYILPNTQNYFKKYWKVAQAALVVFPICGALVGSSYIIRSVVYNADNPNMLAALIAVCVPFLPFFLIPSLLKGALAGLGALGATVTAMGSGLKKGITGAGEAAKKGVEGSNKYKDYVARRQEQKASDTYDKLKSKMKNGQNLTAAERRRYLRTGGIVQKSKKEAESVYGDYYTTQDRDKVEEAFNASLSGHDVEQAGAAFDVLLAKGGISEALRGLEKANWDTMDAGVKERILRGMAGSNVDAMKGFAKYKSSGGAAGFKNWANNTRTQAEADADGKKGVKAQTYAQHLLDHGTNAMDGYSKDEAQFVDSHMPGIQSYMGGSFAKEFGARLGSAGLHSKDAQAQAVWDKLTEKQLGQTDPGSISASNLGIVADDFRIMREGMADAIYTGTETYLGTAGASTDPGAVKDYIQGELDNQITAAKSSSIIMDSANPNVVKKLF